ncbi:MAG: hypothetical protein FWD57_07695 [Polyangiaceae bacterium]|nr:hypothetical protein [Polyangiaceae bacterium]
MHKAIFIDEPEVTRNHRCSQAIAVAGCALVHCATATPEYSQEVKRAQG